MRKTSIFFTMLMSFSALNADAKPVKCVNAAKNIAVVLDISEAINAPYTQRQCLKRDESEPGCKDYYAYSCSCIQYGKSEIVSSTHWKVKGEIRMNNSILPIPEFFINLKGNIVTGEKTVFSGTRITDFKYSLKLYKELRAGYPLIAVVGLYPTSRYGEPGTIVQLTCNY